MGDRDRRIDKDWGFEKRKTEGQVIDERLSEIAIHTKYMDRLEDYFSSPTYTTAIGDFTAKHASVFENGFRLSTEEQPLEYYDVFMKYNAMIESLLEGKNDAFFKHRVKPSLSLIQRPYIATSLPFREQVIL